MAGWPLMLVIMSSADVIPHDADRFTRASLCSSQMVGLAMTRYVWKVGAIAQMSPEDVVRYIAPTIQKYLNGRLGP